MKFNTFLKIIASWAFHLAAILVILALFYPIASWYFNHNPILGVDFFNTASYSAFIRDNLDLLPRAFKYFAYGGVPLYIDTIFHFYWVVSLVAKFLPLIEAVKFSSLGSFFVLLTFMYLASFRLSRNYIFSAVSSVLVAYSANMYGSLTWGGSLPYFNSQLFLPAVIWLYASYLDTSNRRWFWAGVLVLGLSFGAHMASAGAFVFPAAAILLLLGQRKEKVKVSKRILELAISFLGVYLVAFRLVPRALTGVLSSIFSGRILNTFGFGEKTSTEIRVGEGGITVSGDPSIIAFERSRFPILFSDTHILLLVIFVIAFFVFFVAFLIDREKRKSLGVIVWLLLLAYSTLHVFLNAYGIHFLSQAWYRAYWHFPITLGLATAALLGYSHRAISTRSHHLGFVFVGLISVSSIFVLTYLYISNQSTKTIEVVEARSSPSSAHPEAINLARSQEELERVKSKHVPSWINPSDRNYRVFTSDAQVNIWWNLLFDIPLVRGYIDPPIGSARAGHNFLLDQAIGGDDIVENFDYQEEVAKNMALFYIDWWSIGYAEGGHLSKSPNKAPSTYLKDIIDKEEQVGVPGAYLLYETPTGKPEVRSDVVQYLNYYRFKEELVSPILSATDAPTVLCACSWPSYEAFTKILSLHNLNSRYLISVFWDEEIDKLSNEELSDFDALMLSNYRYGSASKAFSRIQDYVKNGGKLFIDTGAEMRESDSFQLPQVFPFISSERKGLGKEWELSYPTADATFDDVNFDQFSPPIFNNDEWKFSYPTSGIKEGAQVLLHQKGKPILIRMKLGNGEVLWSGMNLAYHIHSYSNFEESRFYLSLLRSLIKLQPHKIPEGSAKFISTRESVFNSQKGVEGVILREQFFNGWVTRQNGKKVRAYRVGPASPGFIYVPIKGDGPSRVEFSYWGESSWYLAEAISLLTSLFLLEAVFLNGMFLGRWVRVVKNKTVRKMSSWWEKEENL